MAISPHLNPELVALRIAICAEECLTRGYSLRAVQAAASHLVKTEEFMPTPAKFLEVADVMALKEQAARRAKAMPNGRAEDFLTRCARLGFDSVRLAEAKVVPANMLPLQRAHGDGKLSDADLAAGLTRLMRGLGSREPTCELPPAKVIDLLRHITSKEA